ncbi:hypothetical protein SEA_LEEROYJENKINS_78 [Microbacterium phage LeeroyJenkins]|nr:hypothetical protein SEA_LEEROYJENKINS_78 [Microbacterium phage LeeroyJenkins]
MATPKQIWDSARPGQAFITWWEGDDEAIDADGTVWVKDGIGDLDWGSLVWLAPIEIGERTYT